MQLSGLRVQELLRLQLLNYRDLCLAITIFASPDLVFHWHTGNLLGVQRLVAFTVLFNDFQSLEKFSFISKNLQRSTIKV